MNEINKKKIKHFIFKRMIISYHIKTEIINVSTNSQLIQMKQKLILSLNTFIFYNKTNFIINLQVI
jgi:hypothetical protein